ncbi:hypothetical protein [Rhizobium sp. NLR15a]|nr:hypothetical protein [Rhizobium sp. NLR15a]
MGTNEGVPSVYWRSGFWLAHAFPTNMKALFANRSHHPTPWSLFILSHFFNLQALGGSNIEPERFYEGQKNKEIQFREDLFKRDRDAVESAFRVQIQNDEQKKEILESYFEAQPHRTVSMDISFPTYDYDRSMQTDIAPEDKDVPEFEREAENEHERHESEDNGGDLSKGMTPGGTG